MQALNQWTSLKNIKDSASIPQPYYGWLTRSYVVTKAFRKQCKQLEVQLINLQKEILLPEEVAVLETGEQTEGLVREIHLNCDGKPWSYARVAIPKQTLDIKNGAFETLGEKPIGETLLYNDPTMQRSEFEYRCIESDDALFKSATQVIEISEDQLYARRSIFRVSDCPLMITEIFLPGVPGFK